MNLYGRHGGDPRKADALLTAIIEEAIDETIAPPAPNDPVEPVSAEGFLTDAVAFLQTRPDAAALLRRLQEMVATADTACDAPQPAPETARQPAPEVAPTAVTDTIPAGAPESAPSPGSDSLSRSG